MATRSETLKVWSDYPILLGDYAFEPTNRPIMHPIGSRVRHVHLETVWSDPEPDGKRVGIGTTRHVLDGTVTGVRINPFGHDRYHVRFDDGTEANELSATALEPLDA